MMLAKSSTLRTAMWVAFWAGVGFVLVVMHLVGAR